MNAGFLTFLSAGLCTLVLVATLAEAGGRGRLFDRMDQDGDGLVTRGEAEEARGRWFERLDADGDGYLTIEEMTVGKRRDGGEGEAKTDRRERHFARLDEDGDARVSQAEFAAKSGHWIDRVDGDGDGAVSREEWRIAAERRKGKKPDASAP